MKAFFFRFVCLLLFTTPAFAAKTAPNTPAAGTKADKRVAPTPRVAKRPAPRSAPAKTSVRTYGVFYKGKRVGQSVRTETHNGETIRVTTKTDFTVSFLYFFKTRVQSTGLNLYNRKGELQSFRAVSTVRNRRMKIWGKRTAKGLVVHRQRGKAKASTKTFALKSFDRTSLDYKPVQDLKVTKAKKRRLLMIAQQKVVSQEVTIANHKEKPGKGSPKLAMPLFKVVVKTGKKAGTLILGSDGRMVAANMGRKLRIRLERAK